MWTRLEGKGLAKALEVTQEQDRSPVYAKKYGWKTVFCFDTGVQRLRAIGPNREILQMKVHTGFPPSEDDVRVLAEAAMTGEVPPGYGIYVVR